MIEVTPVAGAGGGECFLLETGSAVFLVDSGFDYCADRTLANIRRTLGDRTLDYILLTHSHYDHASGSAAILGGYPDAKVVAARHAQRVFEKESARDLMRELNQNAAENAGERVENDQIDGLRVDLAVEDGDLIREEGVTVRVLATPGHTRCCVAYHFEEENLLVSNETIGISPSEFDVLPVFIVGYAMTLESIAKCAALNPCHVVVPHRGLISGREGAAAYLTNARTAAMEMAGFVRERHLAGRSQEEIVEDCRAVYYPPLVQEFQPERAFRLNTEAMVARLIQEG